RVPRNRTLEPSLIIQASVSISDAGEPQAKLPRFEIRGDNGRFSTWGFSSQPLLRPESRSLRPPPFWRGIFCLAWIMGATAASGRNPGLSEKSKQREI